MVTVATRTVELSGRGDLQSTVLEDLTSAVRYRRWVADLVEPWLGDEPLEIGSGLGDYAPSWIRSDRRITVSEASPDRLRILMERFRSSEEVAVRELIAPCTEVASHSAVVAINVLEHIEDDVAALRSFTRLIRVGGAVVLFVPALPAAFSRFDREIGHHRRYSASRLHETLSEAGLETIVLHHVNALGALAWLLGMRLLRLRPKDGLILCLWDRFVIPMVRRLESRRRPPFGQSLFAVARVA